MELVTEIYILNRNKKIIDVLSNNGTNPNSPFFDEAQEQKVLNFLQLQMEGLQVYKKAVLSLLNTEIK